MDQDLLNIHSIELKVWSCHWIQFNFGVSVKSYAASFALLVGDFDFCYWNWWDPLVQTISITFMENGFRVWGLGFSAIALRMWLLCPNTWLFCFASNSGLHYRKMGIPVVDGISVVVVSHNWCTFFVKSFQRVGICVKI